MQKIVVIDEEPLIHEVIAAALEDHPYDVTSFHDLDEAWNSGDRNWDLILLHAGLPQPDLVKSLQRMRRAFGSALVLLSSKSHAETHRVERIHGADGVVFKPIDPTDLRAVVEHSLERSAEPPELPARPRCLVVDDDDLVRASVSDILEDARYEVASAESAQAALEHLARAPAEILLTDVMMEGMSGIDLIETLPTVSPDTLALVMTGYATKDLAIRALRLGAFDLLEKPLEPNRVTHAVSRAWQLQRSELENRRLFYELRRLNRDLVDAKNRAEAADRAKSEFLTNMSHEVRTPLNGVLGCLDILGRAQLDPAKERVVGAARESGAILLGMLTGILDYVSLESPEPQPVVELDFAEAIREVVEEARPAIESAGLGLHFETTDPTIGSPAGSRESLQKLVGLLLDNARRFTPEGRIDLRLELDGPSARIEVRDTGIGIEPELHSRVFEPFFQVDGSSTRKVGGTGLGLALCRRLADSFGGRIELESALESGSRFILHLPLHHADG